VVGGLSQALGRFGPAFAVPAIGPAALVVLIAVGFPETARRSLEELNPGDARFPDGTRPSAAGDSRLASGDDQSPSGTTG